MDQQLAHNATFDVHHVIKAHNSENSSSNPPPPTHTPPHAPHPHLLTCSCVCQQTSGGGRGGEYKQLSALSVKQAAGPRRAAAPPEGLEGKRSGTDETPPPLLHTHTHTRRGVKDPGHLSHVTVLRFASGKLKKQNKIGSQPSSIDLFEFAASHRLLLLR